MDAEAILNGPDYFTCEVRRLRMKKVGCVEYQDLARGEKRNNGYATTAIALDRALTCLDCEQGRRIRKEVEMAGKNGEQIYFCKTPDCENEPILTKAGEPTNHGLCLDCFNAKCRETRKKQADLEAEMSGLNEKDEGPLSGEPSPPEPTEEEPTHPNTKIPVEFNDYPNLLEALRKKAIAEMRPVSHQIIFECASGLGMIGG